ncbi:MAG TPA: redoxin domain-containing protein, partial [Candidatus Korarchaeota archaeon]|nr:redoxin domain-containing protein [Candidatus Korarchaeota archaeon]
MDDPEVARDSRGGQGQLHQGEARGRGGGRLQRGPEEPQVPVGLRPQIRPNSQDQGRQVPRGGRHDRQGEGNIRVSVRRRGSSLSRRLGPITLAVAVLLASGASSALAQPKVGAKAPDFTLVSPYGYNLTLSGLLSEGKPVILVFFAHYCPHCRAEIT